MAAIPKMKDMQYIIGIGVRLYPSVVQQRIISKNCGAFRAVYNRLVGMDREKHQLKKVSIYCKPVTDRLDYLESFPMTSSGMKSIFPFLEDKEIDVQTICNAIQNYRNAWNQFRKVQGTSIPTFHKRKSSRSYQTNCHYDKTDRLAGDGNVYITDDGKHLMLPKLGSVKFSDSGRLAHVMERHCPTRIGTVTIKQNAAGEYYAVLQVGSVCPFHKKFRPVSKACGIDLNIENFLTDSDGNVIDNPQYLKKESGRLAKEQKKLSRKAERAKKEERELPKSKNYQKQKKKVAKIHLRIARQREDFQHVQTKHTVESQGCIFVEDLKVKNLLKNHCLARSIADCGWSGYLDKLSYKCAFYGRIFMRVLARNTTQTCSCCGYTLKGDGKLTLKDREWTCPGCGTFHNRDHNAAINVKNKGLKMLASQPC